MFVPDVGYSSGVCLIGDVSTDVSVVDALDELLDADPSLRALLTESLRQAHNRARANLNVDLFDALTWPTSIEEYKSYLEQFARWIPQQSAAKAWAVGSPGERQAQEVSDRLAHHFFLIDQRVPDSGRAIESSPAFGDWLTRFAREWGAFLDTPESFTDEILQSFIDDAPEYNVEDSMVDGRPNMPSGWRTFNQFFARELNGGLRPIAGPADNTTVVSPADCTFQRSYDIADDSTIPATRIKHTHVYGSVAQLLEGSRYAEQFAGGTFTHYMLPPSAYHRFHVPVAGTVREAFTITGQVYMEVDLEDHLLVSKDAASTGYEFAQTRGVLTIDTSTSGHGDLGFVAVVAVGMSHVASVVLTATENTAVAKGEEFGYFQFGGSDIIVLFGPQVAADIDTSTDPRHMGTPIATCTRRT